MNKFSFEYIVSDTLDAITSYLKPNESMKNLIITTFLMESEMEWMVSKNEPRKHGFCQMSFTEFENLINRTIKIDKEAVHQILNIALIDVDNDTVSDMFDALSYNIAFQVLTVYYFYHKILAGNPDSTTDMIDAYIVYWKKAKPTQDNREKVRKTFISYQNQPKMAF